MINKILSFIPSFSTIKYIIMSGLAVVSVVFWSLMNSSKKEFAQAKLKGIKQVRETEQRTNKEVVEGLQREKHNKDNRNYDDDEFV